MEIVITEMFKQKSFTGKWSIQCTGKLRIRLGMLTAVISSADSGKHTVSTQASSRNKRYPMFLQ
jgi:hypothetical protein